MAIIIGWSLSQPAVTTGWTVAPYLCQAGVVKMVRLSTAIISICILDIVMLFMWQHITPCRPDLCGWPCMIVLLQQGSILEPVTAKYAI
jgi:hypothetical protein